ncbi:MAG TPA: FecR domain-containing protein [Chitinophagaceae bacterium]|nr:FecR domain-containing protein [Chitinophagaceae bacterium]
MKFSSDHIHRLLLEKLTGTIEPEDDLALERLIREEKKVSQQWTDMKEQLEQAEKSGFTMEPDVEKSWRNLSPHLLRPPVKSLSFFQKATMAAALVAALVVGGYFLAENNTGVPQVAKSSSKIPAGHVTLLAAGGQTVDLQAAPSQTFRLGDATIRAANGELRYTSGKGGTVAWNTVSVPATASYKVVLSDGTEVWMNSETRLRFPFGFSGKTREVFIDGEAYFKVAKDTERPFLVHAQETVIKVLGTQFNVNTYNGSTTKTSLVEGRVAATTGDKLVHLRPGFEATYNSLRKDYLVDTFDKTEVLSWMKGVYYFRNTSLTDLSKLISRWYNVPVKFENPSLQFKTFSGEILKSQPLESFIENIKLSNQVNPQMQNGVLYFR